MAGTEPLEEVMTDAARFAPDDFRVGQVLSRTFAVLSRNLLPFCLVTAIATLPSLLIFTPRVGVGTTGSAAALLFFGVLAAIVLNALSEAIVLYGAFEDMRGRRVDLVESFKIGLRRFLPVVGVALLVGLLTGLASILLVVPGLIVYTMLFVSMPACIVEQLGPIKSMGRSADLTKGNRWRVFGLWLLAVLASAIVGLILQALASVGGPMLVLALKLIWGALWGAFNAIMVVVTYHDLRVAKEGVDTDQIASVFD
jgi:uncharacterized membrane protein